ncbi:MAG: hypothetical protein IJW59_03540 [Clostridia bacterium]|nr:hypothetical protein [Clostridia bacterium]
MIYREPRYGYDGMFDLRIVDNKGKSFVMTVGGNQDLFWIPENHKDTTTFEIDDSDSFVYEIFTQLFDAVKSRDDKYRPVLKDNVITFVSEEWREEESNVLKIIQEKNKFVIDFIKNQNMEEWSVPHRGCAICFCNSGSRVPRVEQLFMLMFNKLAYHTKEIETVME